MNKSVDEIIQRLKELQDVYCNLHTSFDPENTTADHKEYEAVLADLIKRLESGVMI